MKTHVYSKSKKPDTPAKKEKRSMRMSAIVFSALFVIFSSVTPCRSESEIAAMFKKALYSKDSKAMTAIVENNEDIIPAEIAMLLEAVLSEKDAKEREAGFYVVEYMANEYKNVAKNANLLKEVKRRIFDSRLSPPVRPSAVQGVYLIQGMSSEAVKNVFLPDNIIIKNGGVVRWVNHDKTAHLVASVQVIGEGGMFSPEIGDGQSWEHKFYKPGEYYYICFIHKVMYGKVTVEE
ncbi:MAG TPA: hypothetical protein DCR11_05250 [Deltaproteobacteria bacterium]|nr:hypothetical protein [Deltaproteobacteria bacterium]